MTDDTKVVVWVMSIGILKIVCWVAPFVLWIWLLAKRQLGGASPLWKRMLRSLWILFLLYVLSLALLLVLMFCGSLMISPVRLHTKAEYKITERTQGSNSNPELSRGIAKLFVH
jgi:hypothetical protein